MWHFNSLQEIKVIHTCKAVQKSAYKIAVAGRKFFVSYHRETKHTKKDTK